MKKINYIFLSLFLTGCVNPQFHKNTQTISFKKLRGPFLSIQGYESSVSPKTITVKRNFSSLKGTLSKKGFETKEIEIKSHWTDDEWAEIDRSASAIWLLPPVSTLTLTVGGAVEGAKLPAENSWTGYFLSPFSAVGGAIVGFSAGLGQDIYNIITFAFPRAVLGNPWYEYDKEVDLTKEILTPTENFKQECHKQKNKFIGNNDCLDCQTQEMVISTQDECNRCSNRVWKDSECSLIRKTQSS